MQHLAKQHQEVYDFHVLVAKAHLRRETARIEAGCLFEEQHCTAKSKVWSSHERYRKSKVCDELCTNFSAICQTHIQVEIVFALQHTFDNSATFKDRFQKRKLLLCEGFSLHAQ